jgi:hypothetical protein
MSADGFYILYFLVPDILKNIFLTAPMKKLTSLSQFPEAASAVTEEFPKNATETHINRILHVARNVLKKSEKTY